MPAALAASQFSWNLESMRSPPSVALIQANCTPELPTAPQSMFPWYLDTSMPWTAKASGITPPKASVIFGSAAQPAKARAAARTIRTRLNLMGKPQLASLTALDLETTS